MKTTDRNLHSIVVRVVAIVGWLLIALFSKNANAQSMKSFFDKSEGNYFGYEVAMGTRSLTLNSDVSQLKKLAVSQFGMRAGVVFVNPMGKLRANVGLSYSDGRTPYTINTASAGISANIYLLNVLNLKSNWIEPYVVTSIGFQRSNFFGHYLSKDTKVNYSQSEQPVIGHITWLNTSAGLGVDFKITHSNDQFIHMFTELKAGGNFLQRASVSDLSNTKSTLPVSVVVGFSFGLAR